MDFSQTQTSVSLYNSQYSELFGCSHRQRVTYQDKHFCQQCGLFISNLNGRIFKTLKIKYNAFFDPLMILKSSLQNQSYETLPLLDNTDYLQIRCKVIEFMVQAQDRLRLSLNSVFLAMVYLDSYVSRNSVVDSQMYLFAATALMLAAKANELDERIPFISKLKRYGSMTNHPEINSFRTEEFKMAEMRLIQNMNWKLQHTTLYDKVEAILSFGVMDDEDSLGKSRYSEKKEDTPLQEYNNKNMEQVLIERRGSVGKVDSLHNKIRDLQDTKILELVKEIENNYQEICLALLKGIRNYLKISHNLERMYFEIDHTILALSCVAYLRKKVGLLNIWSQQLQSLTGYSAQKVSATVSQIMTIIAKTGQTKLMRNSTMMTFIPLENTTPLANPTTPTQYAPLSNNLSQNYNTHQVQQRFGFDNQKKSTENVNFSFRASSKFQTALYPSQSHVGIQKGIPAPDMRGHISFNDQKRRTRTNNFTYLNINENNHNSYLQEIEKKFDQKVQSSTSLIKAKLFQGY